MAGKLSEFLAETLRDMDEGYPDDIPQGERQEAVETRDFVEAYTRDFIRSLEGFSHKDARKIPGNPSENWLLEYFLDEYYVRDMVKRIPKMVKRAAKLSQIFPRIIPSHAADLYLREATRSYIYGFWQASVAFSRAALEQGLRERVKQKLGDTPGKLSLLIQSAATCGLLDAAHRHLAGRVKLSGDRVLHGDPATDREAWETLCAARGVLVHLFL
ncbi:MAG: hypothetical protein DMG09_29835 [Acidobacteria bacterium]|nr:MAG: hypothetical protein DMG09_29835 [Acidobacteriota bacterium]